MSCSDRTKTIADFDWQGHRGARGVYPENTVPGFLYALDQGVTTLELDVVITADQQVVASHEPFLNHAICLDHEKNRIEEVDERDFNIYKMTYDQLRQIDCGSIGNSGFPDQQKLALSKPLLAEVIQQAELHTLSTNRSLPRYNIEIKSKAEWDELYHPAVEAYVELVMRVIEQMGIQDRVSIQSFDHRPLKYLHQFYPNIALTLLVEDTASPQSLIADLGFTPAVYSCYHALVDEALVQYCHHEGMKLIPWTVNEREKIERLIGMGVDGIITDYPDFARRYAVQ